MVVDHMLMDSFKLFSIFSSRPGGCFFPLDALEGGEDVGLPWVELLHLLLHQGVLVAHVALQILPLLHQLGVGQHLAVLGHLLNDRLVVALEVDGLNL